jgi:hypothetical protein
MSILGYSSSILTLRPTLIKRRNQLVIKNGFIARLFTIFLFLRKVEICYDDKIIIYSVTLFFLFNKTKLIDFTELSHIDYTYNSIGTSWGFKAPGFGRHDQVESFTISIVTKEKEKYVVCSFRGEGAVSTGWMGIIFGDDIIDFSGTQESDSRQFVSYLSKRLGIPIGKQYDFSKIETNCQSCGRRISKFSSKCMYCGSKIIKNTEPMC